MQTCLILIPGYSDRPIIPTVSHQSAVKTNMRRHFQRPVNCTFYRKNLGTCIIRNTSTGRPHPLIRVSETHPEILQHFPDEAGHHHSGGWREIWYESIDVQVALLLPLVSWKYCTCDITYLALSP
jgi:hypothetical protein